MGKSNKKVKNDRINAIRKRYDAFLEEDKKRRERNEYILGKLDKMRSSTALVPISTKGNNYHMELNPSEIFMRPNNVRAKSEMRDSYVSHLERHNVTSDILNKPVDELRILRDISKKYILIPKRRTPIENDYIYDKDVIDDDWRSKYNILDDLKKLEKEGQSDPVVNQYKDDNNMQNKKLDLTMDSNLSDKQPRNLSNDPNYFDQPISYENSELIVNKSNNSFVEQDKANKQVNFNVPGINSENRKEITIPLQIASISTNEVIKVGQIQPEQNVTQESDVSLQQENITEKEKYNSESNEKDLKLMENSEIYEMNTVNHPKIDTSVVNPSEYNITTAETNKYIASENIKEDRSNAAITDQTISDVKPQEIGAVEYSEQTAQPNRNFDNQKETSEILDFTSTEKVELYDDTDNNPEHLIVANETSFDEPQDYDRVQDTIPVDLGNPQHLENVEHESEINAFEAEQKEMFYSEQTHGDTYAYHQGEGNTGEYTDGYEQNDQYAYYEGVQQEQAYATDINEHEESTERYDPHYNQQYEGSYENQEPVNTVGYENTNAYEQQQFQDENQQFQNIAHYENQQENAHLYQQENVPNGNETQENVLPPQDDQMYDQHLYAEPVTQEHIEQQLITEEGYIESSPDGIQRDNEGEIENVLDTITPEEPMPDPKLT